MYVNTMSRNIVNKTETNIDTAKQQRPLTKADFETVLKAATRPLTKKDEKASAKT